MINKTFITAAALFSALGAAEILSPLRENASPDAIKFQPKLDFDNNGCWNTAAVDPAGRLNRGADATSGPEGNCKDPHQLQNSNAYVRARCNHGICAYMYEYYFEKDQALPGSFSSGHRHDWENVVVFVKGGASVVRVASSCHAGYRDTTNSPILDAGTHPMVVYHKDGGFTHCFRLATANDIAHPENYFGVFYRSPLVGWNGWPSTAIRQSVIDNWSSGVGPKWRDSEFGPYLEKAAGGQVPGFDPHTDG